MITKDYRDTLEQLYHDLQRRLFALDDHKDIDALDRRWHNFLTAEQNLYMFLKHASPMTYRYTKPMVVKF